MISGVYFCFGVKSVLLQTLLAVQCDSEIERVWVVVMLQTIPRHTEFSYGNMFLIKNQHICVFAG